MNHHLILAAGHTAKAAYGTHLGAVATALIVAAVVVIVLKIIARILAPRKKPAGRPSSPYAPAGRK